MSKKREIMMVVVMSVAVGSANGIQVTHRHRIRITQITVTNKSGSIPGMSGLKTKPYKPTLGTIVQRRCETANRITIFLSQIPTVLWFQS